MSRFDARLSTFDSMWIGRGSASFVGITSINRGVAQPVISMYPKCSVVVISLFNLGTDNDRT